MNPDVRRAGAPAPCDRFQVQQLEDGAVRVSAVSSRTLQPHVHDEYGMGVMEAGAHLSASGRGEVEAEAGQLITVNPGEVHDGRPRDGRSRAWRMIYLPLEVVRADWDDIQEGSARPFEFEHPVSEAPETAQLMRRLLGLGRRPDSGLRRDELRLQLLGRLAHGHGQRPRTTSSAGLARARALIEADPARPVSLADLASVAGLSRFQVVRGFVRATGLTPHAYLIGQRVNAARREILDGASLSAAAAAAGFADQSHMHRCFVRRLGFTPGALARAIAPT